MQPLSEKFQRAVTLHRQGELDRSRALYEEILAVNPQHLDALNFLGVLAGQTTDLHRAVQLFDQAIAIDPGQASIHCNRGMALQGLKQLEAALESYDQALALKADYALAHYNRAVVHAALGHLDAAVSGYGQAIALAPTHVEAYVNLGNALRYLKNYEASIASYDAAISLRPDLQGVLGARLNSKMHLCDWRSFDRDLAHLTEEIRLDKPVSPPFPILALSGSAQLHKQVAQLWARQQRPSHSLPTMPKYPRHDVIRLGYFSADFHNHATLYLMAGLFELHDRSRFRLTVFSFGQDSRDAMRRRLVAASEEFIEVRDRSDVEVARLARGMQIDIAIDLKGYTEESRPGIFALRAAPVQVGYLGYPGTSGDECIDYLIADRTLIPADSERHYSERIVYLPGSYQINDRKREIAARAFTREQFGLPPRAFVFCCFNNSYKVTPHIFDRWMRILARVPDSVLWLLEEQTAAQRNLRQEAIRRGIDPKRLIFAQTLPLPEHLARHRLADLFLDTLPYNAHTTASDALWAGLPVLTCMGESFAGRVAGSLLNAIGLPELATSNPAAYEDLAVDLAIHPGRLCELRHRLAAHRLTSPLFDTSRSTQHLEAAYTAMYDRYQADLPAAPIIVEPR